jgi:DNA modification methylase
MLQIDHTFAGTAILCGDSLQVIRSFPDAVFGGIITDPPYASGASDQNARQKSTAQKYSNAKPNCAFAPRREGGGSI